MSRPQTNQSPLAHRLRGGEPAALGDLVRLIGPAFLRQAGVLLRDPDAATEAVQAAFIGIWNGRERLPETEGELRRYCFGVLLNQARQLRRDMALRRTREQEAASAAERQGNPAAAGLALEAWELAMALPSQLRDVLVLRYGQGMTLAETASALDLPPGTVSTRQRTALGQLRERLAVASLLPAGLSLEAVLNGGGEAAGNALQPGSGSETALLTTVEAVVMTTITKSGKTLAIQALFLALLVVLGGTAIWLVAAPPADNLTPVSNPAATNPDATGTPPSGNGVAGATGNTDPAANGTRNGADMSDPANASDPDMPDGPEPGVPTEASRLSGRLLDARTGEPVTGALRLDATVPATGWRTRVDPTVTDGHFSVELGLPADAPLLHLSLELTVRTDGDTLTGRAGLVVQPSRDQALGTVLLRPATQWSASLTGTVVGPQGAPAAGAQVALFDLMQRDALAGPRRLGFTRCDSAGAFRVDRLPAGSLGLIATAAGVGRAVVPELELAADATATVEVRLIAGGVLTGRIATAEGEPVEGAAVTLSRQWDLVQGLGDAVTDADGRYAIADVPAGRCGLAVSAAGFAPAMTELTMPVSGPLTHDIVLRGGHTLHGRVVDILGKPVTRFAVRAWLQGDDEELLARIAAQPVEVTTSDGSFAIAGLQAGLHTIEVIDHEHAFTEQRDVPVGPDADPTTITLEPGYALEGRVTIEGTDTPVANARIAMAQTIRVGPSRWPFMESGQIVTWSGEDGHYRLTGLPGRSVFIRVEHAVHGSERLTVVPADTSGLDIALASDPVRIRGEVYRPDGEPAAGCMVIAQITPMRRFETWSDGAGAWGFPPLPAGSYLLLVTDVGGAAVAHSRMVRLEPGADETFVFGKAGEGVQVAGTVRMADGSPATATSVIVGGGGLETPAVASTDADGRWQVTVPAGEYTLFVQRHGSSGPHFMFRTRASVPPVERFPLDLVVPDGGVTGRLIDASTNARIAGAALLLEVPGESRGGGFGALLDSYAGEKHTGTDPDGRFEWNGIAAGRYRLRVYANGFGVAMADVDVPATGILDVGDVFLVRQSTLRLRLVGPDGQPVPRAIVRATDPDGRRLSIIDTELDGENGDGEVQMEHLTPGTSWTIDAFAPGMAPGRIQVAAGEALEHQRELVLQPGAMLTVRVETPGGDPVEGALVELLDASGQSVPPIHTFGEIYGEPARTGSGGTVIRPSLAAGTYTVRVTLDGATTVRTVHAGTGESSLTVTAGG